jgi:hypothetical protein
VISKYPFWPTNPSHLIVGPPIVPAETGLLDRFIDFFNPLTPQDRMLMKALALTPCSGLLRGKRPLFVIAGEDGVESTVKIGKSTFARMIGSLHESFADIHVELQPKDMIVDVIQNADKRILRFDNVRGAFRTTILERFITSTHLSGHLFSKGYRSYENHTTFIMTVNEPHISEDLATRAIVIRLAPPKAGVTWVEENVQTFLEEHRIGILQDMAYTLSLPSTGYERPCTTRFPTWERTILHRITQEDLGSKFVEDTKKLQDRTAEYEAWYDHVLKNISGYRYDTRMVSPSDFKIFITSSILLEWYESFVNVRYASSRGQAGKDLKKMCSNVGMVYKEVKVNGTKYRGWQFNPESDGTFGAILTRRRDDSFIVLQDSRNRISD